MFKLQLIIKIVTNLLLVCYPLIIFVSLRYGYVNLAILSLVIIFILKLFMLPALFSQLRWFAYMLPCLGLFLAATSWLFSHYQILLYYPVMVNVALLIVFGYSLSTPPTIIERFARMQNPNLPLQAITYTRKVTIVWCIFFIVNGGIALFTCLLENLDLWTLYNGGISYLLMALLMGAEWLIRKRYQP